MSAAPTLVVDCVRAQIGAFTVGPVGFSVGRGAWLALLGRSGAGKSTLLRAIAGLAPLVSGTVSIDGALALAFQRHALPDDATVLQIVARAAANRGLDGATERARSVLHDVGLGPHADKVPRMLSGGMRRRAGLARALVVEPAVLLCDDPTAGLDPATTREILDLILRHAARAAVVVATQDVDAVVPRATRAIVLDRGRVTFDDAPRALAAHPAGRRFAAVGAGPAP